MIQIDNILVPIDFSEPSLAATRYGLELAARFQAKVHLLHVIEDPAIYLPALKSFQMPSRDDFEADAQTRLDKWLSSEDFAHCEMERRWVHGVSIVEILRYANEQVIDLIVLGTHGGGLASHLLLGSVAEKVVRKAPCPVLTVRPEGHQFLHPGQQA